MNPYLFKSKGLLYALVVLLSANLGCNKSVDSTSIEPKHYAPIDSMVYDLKNEKSLIRQTPFDNFAYVSMGDNEWSLMLNDLDEKRAVITYVQSTEHQTSMSKYKIQAKVYNQNLDSSVKLELDKQIRYNDSSYSLVTSFNNRIIVFDEDTYGVMMYNQSADNSVKGNLYSKGKLGKFNLTDNRLKIKSALDLNPRTRFLINDPRFVMFYPVNTYNDNSIFLSYNFIDTIFQYNMKGELTDYIPFPEELQFKVREYDHTQEITRRSLMDYEAMSDQNCKLQYVPQSNLLLLFTVRGDIDSVLKPTVRSASERNWSVSVYSIDQSRWIKIMTFGPEYSYLGAINTFDHLYVRHKFSENFTLHKFEVL